MPDSPGGIVARAGGVTVAGSARLGSRVFPVRVSSAFEEGVRGPGPDVCGPFLLLARGASSPLLFGLPGIPACDMMRGWSWRE